MSFRPYTDNLPQTPLAVFVANVRRVIPTKHMGDLYSFDVAWSAVRDAITNFHANQSVGNFRTLNGAWSRMNRIMMQAEEKYGAMR